MNTLTSDFVFALKRDEHEKNINVIQEEDVRAHISVITYQDHSDRTVKNAVVICMCVFGKLQFSVLRAEHAFSASDPGENWGTAETKALQAAGILTMALEG